MITELVVRVHRLTAHHVGLALCSFTECPGRGSTSVARARGAGEAVHVLTCKQRRNENEKMGATAWTQFQGNPLLGRPQSW